MLKKILKNKKAQNTAEYAILISLVVAGIIAMQTYAQRALQAKVRDASAYMADETAMTKLGIDTVAVQADQYEPYYLSSTYTVDRLDDSIEIQDHNTVSMVKDSSRNRASGGNQVSTYDRGIKL